MIPPTIHIREAQPADAAEAARLIQVLAETGGSQSQVSTEYVLEYLTLPGSGILIAQNGEKVAGLLSYSIRPSLYHAGNGCLIEELVVEAESRSQGVGAALLAELMSRAQSLGCIEVSVTVMPDNLRAIKFYKAHGLVDEAILLEKHLL